MSRRVGISKITCIFTDLKIINLYFHIMKRHITFALLFAAALTAQAQQGGISSEMLNQIKQSYRQGNPQCFRRNKYQYLGT